MSGLGFKVESVCPQICPPVAERLKGRPADNCHAASQGPGDSLGFLTVSVSFRAMSPWCRLRLPTFVGTDSQGLRLREVRKLA